jgi:TonB family protein
MRHSTALLALLVLLAGSAAAEPPASTPGSKIASLHDLDRFPVPRHLVPPVCPDSLGKLTDRVRVTFVIDEQGAVTDPEARSGTNRALREAAVAAVAQWRFDPPTRQGVPVRVAASQIFLFAPRPIAENGTAVMIPGSWGAADESATPTAEIFDISKLDRSPKPLQQPRPRYPAAMKKARITGEAVVDFIVDSAGNVQNAYAVSSTRAEFEQPSVDSVSQWKFEPGRKNGRPVNVHLQVPIVYSLSP